MELEQQTILRVVIHSDELEYWRRLFSAGVRNEKTVEHVQVTDVDASQCWKARTYRIADRTA